MGEKKNTPVVKYSQPKQCAFIVAGGIMLCVTTMIFGLDASDAMCVTIPWLGHLGYTFLYVPLLIKTHRISRVFNNKKLKKRVITDADCFKKIGMYTGVIIIYLAIWTATDSPRKGNYDDAGASELSRHEICQMDGSGDGTFLAAGLAVQGLALLWGVSLAVQTYNVDARFSEAKYMAMSIYNTLFVVVIVCGLGASGALSHEVHDVVNGLGLFVATLGVMILIFFPKMKQVAGGADFTSGTSSSGSVASTVGAGSTVSSDEFDAMKAKLDAEMDKVAELEAEIARLKEQ